VKNTDHKSIKMFVYFQQIIINKSIQMLNIHSSLQKDLAEISNHRFENPAKLTIFAP
jgi:hypothetical protein